RLLINRPKILLLDEPTANLDQGNISRVEALINNWRIQQACAVIWVTHDREQQKRVASRHFEIEAGRLREYSWS
ncbi:MAG: ABC transporter ATP-binding protein, partial [Pseudomonadota bacterium]